jgi:hypothetical protein
MRLSWTDGGPGRPAARSTVKRREAGPEARLATEGNGVLLFRCDYQVPLALQAPVPDAVQVRVMAPVAAFVIVKVLPDFE